MVRTIGNPLSWTAAAFGRGAHRVGVGTSELGGEHGAVVQIRDLTADDVKLALRKGMEDFTALRTDVIFIVLIYPVLGLLLVWFALNTNLLPLAFPLISGFALLGPVAAIGLYEMSRRRELGMETSLGDGFAVINSPAFAPVLVLGFYLFAMFVAWMISAYYIYYLTLGPEAPSSISGFISDIFTTGAGWAMLIIGVIVGFFFAALVLATSVVSFPLLIDRHVGVPHAVVTSMELTKRNPGTVALWGLVVVVMLGIGAVTFFIGMIIVLPVLGHATWHLYRRAVVPLEPAAPEPEVMPS
ncbi:DUF2189 domain-containing protein [Sulfitobacter aestuarii]|uniref:DUF2189 domain-containing protein n=1 Tax=Sulfitobacter aestuarii TaxID=2161676 RepID=A0ABW5U1S1_9RHOB